MMSTLNKFTFAICTYNGEKTLERAIESILSLNMFDEFVEEVLLIDNASNDSTAEICLKYVKMNEKVHYIFEKNPGLANARRNAVNTNADWVVYVDDDNVLEKSFLVELKKTILENPQAGVINGAVIATPLEELSVEEDIRLQLLYRNLACTHIRSIDNVANLHREAVGAGMCVRTKALKVVEKEGWLKLVGRKGNKLLSGEDTELSNRILQQGYLFIINYKISLYHLIPSWRLTEDYATKLIAALTESYYQYISGSKRYVLSRFLRAIKYLYMYINCYIKGYNKKNSEMENEKIRQNKIRSKTFLKCVLNDKLLHR